MPQMLSAPAGQPTAALGYSAADITVMLAEGVIGQPAGGT
jgi:hypothetical protein